MGLLHHISFKRDNGRTEELDLLVSTSDCYLDLCLIQSQPKYQQILSQKNIQSGIHLSLDSSSNL